MLYRRALVAALALALVACDVNITTAPGDITNTNTNTNTNNLDVHDLVNFAPAPNPATPVPAPGGGTEQPLPLPAGAQATANGYAAGHPTQLARSCQEIYGETAWQYLDGLVATLRRDDPRWGYMVKPTDGQISRDVIAYRATSDNTGSWGVDVIVDRCGANTPAWNVLGFDPAAQWAGTRF
jgi:hypothetical protein